MELREVPHLAERRGGAPVPAAGRARLRRARVGDREEPALIRIEDPADPVLEPYRNLREPELRKRYEQQTGVFVVEGERAIRRALGDGWQLESVLMLEAKAAALGRDLEGRELEERVGAVLVAPPEIVEAVTGFPFHRGALAICRRRPSRDFRELAAGTTLVLVVEAVNDHENMGALFRNAAAFGAGAVLLDPSCCDPLYRRSVRVSLGNVLAVPFATVRPWPDSLEAIRGDGFTLVALTPSGGTSLDDAARNCAATAGKLAVMVGSEDQGLSEGALAAAGIRVRIPMAEGVDSLNVATAAAVALSRLRPGGGPHLV